MSEISKLIIPGNTIPYDLRDDYAREKINNNHLFIVSPLRTGIVNAYALLGRDVEPYEGLMLHILCSNDQNDSIAPASIRLEENGSTIPIDYATSAGHPINNQIYSFILHQIPEEGATPAYWNFYPMDDGLISKGIKIIEYTTGASTAYTQVENAIIAGQLPVVHVSDSTNEYYLPLYGFLDTDTYYFVANLMKGTFTVKLTTTAWQTINMNLLGEEDLSYIVQTVPQTLSTAYKAQARTNIDAATGQSVYYGTCDTGSTTAAKVVTGVSNWPTTLSAGQIILITFTNTNTAANPTLSINGSTAAPILTYNGASSAVTWGLEALLLFVYDGRSWRLVDGNNINTIGYQLRTNAALRKAADKGYGYRLWFQTLEGTYAPANLSTSTNPTVSKTPNPRIIDPFGEIVYMSTTATVNAGANMSATTTWQQYTLNLGHSFNTTGAALTLTNPAPVYLKCTPVSSGGATMDGIVQTLPSTADGKIYIYLGQAYSATSIELVPYHPVYEYRNGAIRPYTAVNDKLDKNQGSANAGKFMVVDSNGDVVPTTITMWNGGSY